MMGILYRLQQSVIGRSHRMQVGGIEQGHAAAFFLVVFKQQRQFGATENDTLTAFLPDEPFNHAFQLALGFVGDNTFDQFFVNDAVDLVDFHRFGDNDFDLVIAKAVFVEIFFHCKASAEQADFGQLLAFNFPGGDVTDVQHFFAADFFNLFGNFMHGVGCDDQNVGVLQKLFGVGAQRKAECYFFKT